MGVVVTRPGVVLSSDHGRSLILYVALGCGWSMLWLDQLDAGAAGGKSWRRSAVVGFMTWNSLRRN